MVFYVFLSLNRASIISFTQALHTYDQFRVMTERALLSPNNASLPFLIDRNKTSDSESLELFLTTNDHSERNSLMVS